MIGPTIPKEILEERNKQALKDEKSRVEDDSDSDSDDEIIGPELILNSEIVNEAEPKFRDKESINKEKHLEATSREPKRDPEFLNLKQPDSNEAQMPSQSKVIQEDKRPTLLQKHQKKLKDSGISERNRITKYDHKENLNTEIRKEIFRKLDLNGGLKDKFTRGSSS